MVLYYALLGVGMELIILFFITRTLTKQLFRALFRLSKNRHISVSILMVLLFPGTILHELSHLFVAEVLGVHTGKLTITPEFESHDTAIQAGSVMIQKTDPIRRTLIGVAPLFTGLGALTAIAYTITLQWQSWIAQITEGSYIALLVIVGIIYLTFAISNTMFSSSEDMKGVFPLLLVLSLFAIGCYMVGFRIVFPSVIRETATNISIILCQTIGGVIGVNLVFLLFSTWITKNTKK